ncbi:hypothetical protein D7223_17190 [Micromonospora endolithica]|uniref:Uncharacterized protein n=1 Tax=Micromonospora endolithica TaxID=230091 RepID=A0A3A9ZAK3_9ACTN|nr:hypothetical protein D7223_17190 [Micromonospora endolithica]
MRLKSSNFPDHVVRHANNIGRVDPYPRAAGLATRSARVPARPTGRTPPSASRPDRGRPS